MNRKYENSLRRFFYLHRSTPLFSRENLKALMVLSRFLNELSIKGHKNRRL